MAGFDVVDLEGGAIFEAQDMAVTGFGDEVAVVGTLAFDFEICHVVHDGFKPVIGVFKSNVLGGKIAGPFGKEVFAGCQDDGSAGGDGFEELTCVGDPNLIGLGIKADGTQQKEEQGSDHDVEA